MDCPRCRKPEMINGRIRGSDVAVDRCGSCGGLWFDGSELTQVLDVAMKELSVPRDAIDSGYVCPRDGKPLYSFQYPQTRVMIGMCKKCEGLWLDKGDMTGIKQARESLAKRGLLQERDEVSGVRGRLLRFIDSAMAQP